MISMVFKFVFYLSETTRMLVYILYIPYSLNIIRMNHENQEINTDNITSS